MSLAVRAVIVDDADRVLMIRRSKANRSAVGRWEWPGGKCEPGEPFDEALMREVREETGLTASIDGVVGATGFEVAAARVVLLCMEARIVGGALRLSEEHDESAWVSLAELSRLELVDNVRSFMLEYAAKKGAGE